MAKPFLLRVSNIPARASCSANGEAFPDFLFGRPRVFRRVKQGERLASTPCSGAENDAVAAILLL
ncbi:MULTISPECIES: hypothetical protein [unclassified Phaeobacter]|uniref:hypothetical protein n=1 Tax=unclassified Phaeobacter TaxID=2621772 RepID=UPI003A85573A